MTEIPPLEFRVIQFETFKKKFSKLTPEEQEMILSFAKKLKENPFLGKPLGTAFLREKKFDGKRAYFVVYEKEQYILMVRISDKKDQQKEIEEVKRNQDVYRYAIQALVKRDQTKGVNLPANASSKASINSSIHSLFSSEVFFLWCLRAKIIACMFILNSLPSLVCSRLCKYFLTEASCSFLLYTGGSYTCFVTAIRSAIPQEKLFKYLKFSQQKIKIRNSSGSTEKIPVFLRCLQCFLEKYARRCERCFLQYS